MLFQGPDHLTATWKVSEGVHAHLDIREEGKENAFSIGSSLWIGNEVSVVTTIVLVSRASWCLLDTQTIKDQPSAHPNFFGLGFVRISFSNIYLNFFSS